MSSHVLLVSTILSSLLNCFYAEELPGHGKPLGDHHVSDGHVDIFDTFPTPQEFWDKYMSIGEPCLFRGAANKFPAKAKWTNDYLRHHYGDLEVKLEHKYEKKNVPVGTRGVGRDTIKSFLDTYLDEPKYIVSQLPDPMAKEILVLPFLSCGSYKERLLESNLWLSSGGTKSMLHKDADNAINCLLNGTKEWILIHPNFTEKIPVAEGDRGYGGFAVLDVDRVNMKRYPNFQDVHYNHVNMKAGDCLFLPKSYWHQVNSYGIQNLAVSVLFSRLTSFRDTGCHGDQQYVPLSEAGMIWTYPGHGPQTLGNFDPFELRDNLFDLFDASEKVNASVLEKMLPDDEKNDDDDFKIERKQLSESLLKIFDTAKKGYLQVDDIKSATLFQLKDAAIAIDPDPANSEEYEHFLLSPDNMMEIMEKSYGDNVLKRELFLTNYQKLGGSLVMGKKVFKVLNDDVDADEISVNVVKKNMENVISLYAKRQVDDPSRAFYQKSLKEDKKIMDEVDIEVVDDYDIEMGKKIIKDSSAADLLEIPEEEDNYPAHEPMYQPSESEDDYPEHEPMYQPSENENDYPEDKSDREEVVDNRKTDYDKPVLSYEDDFNILLEEAQKLVANGDDHFDDDHFDDEIADHEPIYQPSEQDDIEDHEPTYQSSDQKDIEDREPISQSYEQNDGARDEPFSQLFGTEDTFGDLYSNVASFNEHLHPQMSIEDEFVDENEDGYPDHEPLYQPEDGGFSHNGEEHTVVEEIESDHIEHIEL